MIALELEIKNLLESLAPTSGVAKQLSKTKKILDSSSHMVEAVDNFSKALKKNVGKGLGGGITAGVSGWVASKTTKVVGGLGAGAVSAILQTTAAMIPDSSDPKSTDTDLKIAQLINNYTLPKDKNELFDLLQWIYVQLQSDHTPFGDQTIESLEKIHQRTYEMLKVLCKNDEEMTNLSKQYAPKKKFIFWKG